MELPLVIPWQHANGYSGLHLYVIRLRLDKIMRSHRQVFEFLRERRILVNLHYVPVYLHPYFENLGFRKGLCTEAERYYPEAISLPMFPGLTVAQQDHVVAALREATAK
jgi:dTDP-4-amino-4,6-dideoxygalactose transaminase